MSLIEIKPLSTIGRRERNVIAKISEASYRSDYEHHHLGSGFRYKESDNYGL